MTHPIINILKTEQKYLEERKKTFIFYMILFVFAAIVDLANPYILGTVFNSIQQSITTKVELWALAMRILLLLVVEAIFWLFHGFARVLETSTGFLVKRNYIYDKIKIVFDLPIKWHKDNHSGDTINKINRAANSLEEFSSHITYQIVYGIIAFLGSLIILVFIEWQVGVFAFIFSMITLFIISRVDKRLYKKYKQLNVFSNKASATVFDYVSNVITVITLRLKNTVSKKVYEKESAGYPTFKNAAKVNEMKWGFASVSIRVMIVALLIYKAYSDFGTTGTIMIGTLYMVYGYLNNVGNTFYKFAELYGKIIRSNARLVGANPLDEEYNKLDHTKSKRLPKKWKNIVFKDISFKYDVDGKTNHLDNINLLLKKGQKIALVGESGSGKSTILSLIRGLYNVNKGEILCNGKPLKGKVNEIKDSVTLIPQDPEIFNNTFRYNITMDLSVKKEDVKKVIDMSQLSPVLEKLPQKLDTNVMERGVSLSGGEKQRLALARGLLAAKKSDIVLMDEPTSSVDSINEIKIHEKVFKEFKDKTIVSSIHRLHLLDMFDYIYFFSRGKLVAQGTLEELKKNPRFKKLWLKYNKVKEK